MLFSTEYALENILIPAVAGRAVHVDSSVSNLVFLHEQSRDGSHNTFGCADIINTVQSLHISLLDTKLHYRIQCLHYAEVVTQDVGQLKASRCIFKNAVRIGFEDTLKNWWKLSRW